MSEQFGRILLGTQGKKDGRFLLGENGLEWRSAETDRRVSIPLKKIQAAEWSPLGKMGLLRVTRSDGEIFRFLGFKAEDQATFQKFFQEKCDVDLEEREQCATGGSWGDLEVEGTVISVSNGEGLPVFDIPMSDLAQIACPNKNEIEFQFQSDDTLGAEEESLVELRFFVPQTHQPSIEELEDEDTAEEKTPAQVLQYRLAAKAGIESGRGDAIASFAAQDCMFLTPRGRFDIEMHPRFMRMRGATYNFAISYKSLARMIYLPKPDNRSVYIMISLDDPIRHKSVQYSHLVISVEKKVHELEVRMPEEQLKVKYPNLKPTLEAELPFLMARVFREISGKKVFQPGKFSTSDKAQAVRCSLESNEGYLFPLDKSLVFVHKPAKYIRYSEIDNITPLRVSESGTAASRTFDLQVTTKAMGGTPGEKLRFVGIDKAEYDAVYNFLATRDVKLAKRADPNAEKIKMMNVLNAEDSGDEDDEEEESDSDFDIDAAEVDAKRQEKEEEEAEAAEGDGSTKEKKEKKEKSKKDEEEEDEDEEDEEDYEEGSASGSDESGSNKRQRVK